MGEFRKATAGLPDGLELAVGLAPSGHVSGRGTVGVSGAYEGFDWERGRLVLNTEKPVDLWTAKCTQCALRDDCRVTSKMRCVDFGSMSYELTVFLDGRPKFSVAYSFEDLKKGEKL